MAPRLMILLFHMAPIVAMLFGSQHATLGQVVFEDFRDGHISDDSGLEWIFSGEHAVSEDGLLLTSEAGSPVTASAFDTDIQKRSWSLRMQVRLQGNGTFGIETIRSDWWTRALIDADGTLHASSKAARSFEEASDLEPNLEDVIVQFYYLDGLNEFLGIQAWRVGENPATTEDSLGGTFTLSGVVEDPAIWMNAEDELFSAELRWLAFMPADRMPVHIPISVLLLDCNYDQQYTNEFGWFDDDIPEADELLTVDDIACSSETTIQPLLEQIGVSAGDANLDGRVDFADFLRMSSNFGSDAGWSEGDFNANGSIDFTDFLLLSSNFEGSVNASAVPEPNGVAIYWAAIFISFGTRKRRRTSATKTSAV